jgi:hypothetical protein
VGRTADEDLLDPRELMGQTLAAELGDRPRVVGRQERRGDRERHGALAGADLGDEEGIDAPGEELERRLDGVGLGLKGLPGEGRKSDPMVLQVWIVEGRELLGEKFGERTVVVGDEIGRVISSW